MRERTIWLSLFGYFVVSCLTYGYCYNTSQSVYDRYDAHPNALFWPVFWGGQIGIQLTKGFRHV